MGKNRNKSYRSGGGFSRRDDESEERNRPEAIQSLVRAFADTYEPVASEDMADELFTMRKLRSYFAAYIVNPKAPDPLTPYFGELEKYGFRMQTCYDEQPAMFVAHKRGFGEPVYVEEISDAEQSDEPEGSEEDFRAAAPVSLNALMQVRMEEIRQHRYDESDLPWDEDKASTRVIDDDDFFNE